MTARTLREYLADPKGDGNHAPRELSILIEAISDSCRTISYLVSRGALADVLGSAGTGNVQGEEQKQLDVLANDELMAMAKATDVVAAAASEEEDEARSITPGAPYLLLFDPLDGSSNIDVNVSIGTIFSIRPRGASTAMGGCRGSNDRKAGCSRCEASRFWRPASTPSRASPDRTRSSRRAGPRSCAWTSSR